MAYYTVNSTSVQFALLLMWEITKCSCSCLCRGHPPIHPQPHGAHPTDRSFAASRLHVVQVPPREVSVWEAAGRVILRFWVLEFFLLQRRLAGRNLYKKGGRFGQDWKYARFCVVAVSRFYILGTLFPSNPLVLRILIPTTPHDPRPLQSQPVLIPTTHDPRPLQLIHLCVAPHVFSFNWQPSC